MAIRKLRGSRRWGAAAIETVLVLIPTLMLLFGVFEYGRLLMDWNVLNNAAREGCRYALANNTSRFKHVGKHRHHNAGHRQDVVRAQEFHQTPFTVTVSGIDQGTTYTGNNVNNLVAGDLITVTVSGKYVFMNIIPFHVMPSLTINSAVTMVCEGAS